MRVDIYSHSVMLSPVGDRQFGIVREFLRRLVQWDQVTEDGETKFKAIRTYATTGSDRKTFRIHKHLLEEFLNFYKDKHYQKGELQIEIHDFNIDDSYKVEFKVKQMYEPRDNQPNVIEHLLKRKELDPIAFDGIRIPREDNNKVITMPTGTGKTFVSQYVMKEQGLRTVYMMRSSYIDRWVPDLEETFKLKRGDLQVVQGSASLRAILENAQDDVDRAKIYLISTNTFTNYLDSYDSLGDDFPYPVAPIDFFKVLKVGSAVLDEGHQLPHMIMKYYTHLHIYKQTTLSATLDTQDKFMDKILKIMYPEDMRYRGGEYAAHIKVTALRWKLGNPRRIQYMGFKGYSHAKFETSMMSKKNKAILDDYFNLVAEQIQERYIDKNLSGTKALVFFATIEMCTLAVEYFSKRFKGTKFARYVSADKPAVKKDALENSDVIVSTIQSCGTAVDIPNLLVSIMTTAVDSQQSNQQTVGRTRPLKAHPGVHPEFVYFLCDNIQRHYDYHRNKVKFFKHIAISHDLEDTDTRVGRPPQDGSSGDNYQQTYHRPWNGNRTGHIWNKGDKKPQWGAQQQNNYHKKGNFNKYYQRNDNNKWGGHVNKPNFDRGNRMTWKRKSR